MAEEALGWLSRYGAPALFAALFVAGLGVPSPAALMAVAAGYLVRSGRADPIPLLLAGFAGMTLGHFLMYTLARRGIGGFLRRAERKRLFAKAKAEFERHEWRAIHLSRWLVTPLGLPITLLAGSGRYPTIRFLTAAGSGNLVWLLLFGGAGVLLGGAGSLESAARWVGLGLGIAGAIAVAAWLVRRRVARATPAA